MISQLAPLALQGFVFGWSVAWPPGPINAEIARRAIAVGAMSALAVAMGAGSGDALWAMLTSLGAGLFLDGVGARLVLGWVSTALLLALAALFLGGAWRALRGRDRPGAPRSFERGRAGYALGLGMSL
ncbi:MAG: LysE family transporter, partial [Stellaceae bacterium]